MKTTTLHVLLMAGMLSVSACGNGNNNAGNMADSAAAKMDTAVKDIKQGAENVANDVKQEMSNNPDSNFVVKATTTNMAELKVLQAGIDNGTSKELKAHARMMQTDHKKLGADVQAYAARKGYALPTDDGGKGDEVITDLDKHTKGADWDKAWVDHMISAHEDAISMFENYQNKVGDPDLKNMITNALTKLHEHLDMMKDLQNKMGK